MYQSHSSKTPMEDFTTELLRGVLASNQELTDAFVQHFFKVEETGFSIEAQKSYPEYNSKVDMVFENQNTLIFLENKIYSEENYAGDESGNAQLDKYADILASQSKKKYMGYCTKFLDIKDARKYQCKNVDFVQFRWSCLYLYLNENLIIFNDGLIISFLKYLKDQGMSKPSEFIIEDLSAMKRLPYFMRAMEECFALARPEFERLFGDLPIKPINRDTQANFHGILKQIIWHNRYAIHCKPLLNGDKTASVWLKFQMGDSEWQSPFVCVQFFIEKTHPQYVSVRSDLDLNKDLLHGSDFYENNWGSYLEFKKSLSDFISNKNQFNSIKIWFEEMLSILHEYMTSSSTQLMWKVSRGNK